MQSSATTNAVNTGIEQALEALILTSEKPVQPAAAAQALTEAMETSVSKSDVESAVESINESLDGRSFRIERVAGGYKAIAISKMASAIAAFQGARAASKLSRAAIETLAIVAYRQPITRAEIEAIRGVASGEVLRSLLDRRLLTIAGRAEELGRPMLYGTTKEFLTLFGLADIGDLPKPESAT